MTISTPYSAPKLIPELKVTSLPDSLAFWRDILGFAILYDRPEEGFARIERDGTEFMLDEYDNGPAERLGIWDVGAREYPLGRGINFQISVEDVEPLLMALAARGWPLFFGPEERWYRASDNEIGVRQFLVQDPDGYLLRFSQPLGLRKLASA